MNRFTILLAALGLALLVPSSRAASQFVEITAELEMDGWSYWFLEDKDGWAVRRGKPAGSVFTKPAPIRIVVGTNTWLMESEFFSGNSRLTRWFTGRKIIERGLITKPTSGLDFDLISQKTGLATKEPRMGEEFFREYPTDDGNPGRPGGSADLFMDASGMMTWLAFCSGPALKREGRKIPPPSAFWKEYFSGDFVDKTACFDDSLGLPRTIEVFTKQGQTVLRYQVRQSTNVLGWNFPLEFYLIQYERSRTNSFEVALTAKGRMTAIAPGVEPRVTAENRGATGK